MSTHRNPHLKRTNLFLVRIWAEDAGDKGGNTSSKTDWQGKVQRVIDGESHPFSSLQDLLDLLLEMLSSAGD